MASHHLTLAFKINKWFLFPIWISHYTVTFGKWLFIYRKGEKLDNWLDLHSPDFNADHLPLLAAPTSSVTPTKKEWSKPLPKHINVILNKPAYQTVFFPDRIIDFNQHKVQFVPLKTTSVRPQKKNGGSDFTAPVRWTSMQCTSNSYINPWLNPITQMSVYPL